MLDRPTIESPVHRPCPVCTGVESRPWLVKGSLVVVRCQSCGMLFANPVERSLIDGRFYEQRADSYYLSPDKLEGDYAAVRFARELRIFQRYCPQGDVLDVGCSTGAFLHQLMARAPGCHRVLGNDVAGRALDYAESRGVPVRRGAFEALEFGTQRFDAVTFWAVLEHLAEPAVYLAKAESLLKPGGHLFALVPNMHSLAIRVLGPRYRYLVPEHLNYFTAATLRRLATVGRSFEIRSLRSTHFNPVVIWKDFCRKPGVVGDAERAGLLRRTNRWKESRRLGPLRLVYAGAERLLGLCGLADNLMIVLRKPVP